MFSNMQAERFCLRFSTLEMITVTGETVKASATESEELFWAMKGFGPNFG
jgi:hypothetical protein